MKISAVKHLVENYDIVTMQQMREEIENEQPLSHEVEGDDEGEKLTHILGAIWIKEQMFKNASDFKTELRNFTSKVRTSIS